MNPSRPEYPTRKPLRAPGFGYQEALCCFITFCTWNRQCLFGHKTNGAVFLNPMGEMIIDLLLKENDFYPSILNLDAFAVMPDHIHLLVTLEQTPSPLSIPDYLKSLKTRIRHSVDSGIRSGIYSPYKEKLWQRSYYDHVIRDEADYFAVIQYIRENPRADFDRMVENGEIIPLNH